MEAEYRMEEGKYAFYLDGECLMTCEEVAFLVDLGTNGRLMHGEPGPVEARLQLMSAAFRGAGFHKEADDLVVIKGKFTLEELDKLVNIADYPGRFYRVLMAHGTRPCEQCHGTGDVDSGGTFPWGEPVTVPCACVEACEDELVGGRA